MKEFIGDLDKAAVLAALYNGAAPMGLGFLQYDPTPMTVEEAQEILRCQTAFRYLKGRVLYINLSGQEIDGYLYDRDNGPGAMAYMLKILRNTGDVNELGIRAQHTAALTRARRAGGLNTQIP